MVAVRNEIYCNVAKFQSAAGDEIGKSRKRRHDHPMAGSLKCNANSGQGSHVSATA